jgi:hypothetical protein
MGHSPRPIKTKDVTISKTKTLDFHDAVRAMVNGKRVRREEWNNDDYIYIDQPGFLMIQHDDREKPNALMVSDGDVLGEDYVIVG